MPQVKLSPVFNSQVVDENGNPAVGWKINTYAAGSSTPLATYTDSTGNTPQSNPIVLDSMGFPQMGQIWLQSGRAYKLQLTDANGVVKKTEDNVTGVNDTSVSTDEWGDTGLAPTYISATSFSLVGDQTSAFHVGRRVKLQVTAGTVYGRITSSVFTSLTTVTMVMDGSQVLDSGLSVVQLSNLRANVLSLPERIGTVSGTDTYTASVGIARLVKGDQYKLTFTNANLTGAPTLNLDSMGALALVGQNGAALLPGTINGEHTVRYNGTNFTVLNPIALQIYVGTRQTVLSAPADANGVPNFLPSTSANLNLTSQNITSTLPLIVTSAGGFGTAGNVDRIGMAIANLTWTGLTPSTTNYLYVDVATNGVLTPGFTTLAPAYQYGGTASPTNGAFTLDYARMVQTVGNGTAAVTSNRVYVGEAVTSGTAVTSTVAYLLNGRARIQQNTLAASSAYTLPAPIGTKEVRIHGYLECVTAELGFAVGDRVPMGGTSTNGSAFYGTYIDYSGNSAVIITYNNGIACGNKGGGGGGTPFTNANWRAVGYVERVF